MEIFNILVYVSTCMVLQGSHIPFNNLMDALVSRPLPFKCAVAFWHMSRDWCKQTLITSFQTKYSESLTYDSVNIFACSSASSAVIKFSDRNVDNTAVPMKKHYHFTGSHFIRSAYIGLKNNNTSQVLWPKRQLSIVCPTSFTPNTWSCFLLQPYYLHYNTV